MTAGPDKSDEKRSIYVWIYENGAKELKSRPLSGRFVLSKGDNTKIKGKVGPFFFHYPFIFLSLPSFLYILPVCMAWRRPKRLLKSRQNKGDRGRIL